MENKEPPMHEHHEKVTTPMHIVGLNEQHHKKEDPSTTKFETYLNELFQKVPSTTEILLYNKLQEKNIDAQWIEWANKMLEAGYTTDNLLKFSKRSPDVDNQITLIGLANVILDELNLDSIPIEDILKFHGIHLARQAINNEKEIFETLESLRDLFYYSDYHIFYDFPLLWKAYEQLKKYGEQIIWEDSELDFRNKDEYIKIYLRNWIENSSSKIVTSIIEKNPIQRFFSLYAPFIIFILIIIVFILIIYYSYQSTDSVVFSIIISLAAINPIVLAYRKYLK